MINISQLTKYYGKSKGIENVSLDIHKGEIFGLIGPNGAGKSTMIRLLLSLIRPTKGKAEIKGMNCFSEGRKIKQILGYVPAEVNYYDDMKVIDLFRYSARFYHKNCEARARDLSSQLSLDTNKKINALSYGNKKKVAIVQALLHKPEIIILDEPTSGLDPLMQDTFFEIMEDERKKGTTILFSSHVLREVQKTCDRVAIIKDGGVLKTESIESLHKNTYRQIELVFSDADAIPRIHIPGMSNLTIKGKSASFIFSGNIQALIEALTHYQPQNLSIEEPPHEEVFRNYYQNGSVAI